ncbi:MAG: peptidase M4 family protein [Caldilineaceae bacterium]|nr:peptidase M4 family protein [Caldilineaceae bacterium]
MKKRIVVLSSVITVLMALVLFSQPGFSQPSTGAARNLLRQQTGSDVEITWNAITDAPSFLRGSIPVVGVAAQDADSAASAAFAFAEQYAALFGLRYASQELGVTQNNVDALNMRHVTFQQVYQGVEVYGAQMKLHFGADGQEIVAVGSSIVPGIVLVDTEADITSAQAIANAAEAMPNGLLHSLPQLVIYAPTNTNADVRLTWMVELRDDTIPARTVYVIDAKSGAIIDAINRLYEGRDRKTYDARNTFNLPGSLVRSEGDGAFGDTDVDNAHDFAGETYDYYWNVHGRDSYDDQGAALISTANYGDNYLNAFWNGVQMVYGDHFAVDDVVAHELTHAVTEHSAQLEYRWQSGALNESFSDIFGAMVDRDDWLMGEDLPSEVLGGRDAIRDLADPTRFSQPAHTDDWVATCSDEEGVHTNSGITNKAFYNIATAIGKDKAEQIFYRTLTVYLGVNSSLEDARAGALQSAQDIYGAGSVEYGSVETGFNNVGLDGAWQPEPNDCTCAASTAIEDENVYAEPVSALAVASTLYRTRDQLLTGEAGLHYRTLYEAHTGRISYLLITNGAQRASGGEILKQVTPGLDKLMDGDGDEVIIEAATVEDVLAFLTQLAEDDLAKGDGELAATIEEEMRRIDWDHLVGMTYDEAWTYIQSRTNVNLIHLPMIAR